MRGIPSKVLARGPFLEEQIDVKNLETAHLPLTKEMHDHVEREWKLLVEKASSEGKNVYNGISQRVETLSVSKDNILHIELAPFAHKYRACLRSFPEYYALDETFWTKGAYTGAFVSTKDGWYIFATLSGKSHNENREEMLGGIVGDDGFVTDGTSLFDALYKEVEEEACIPKSSIERATLELVYGGPHTNIGFLFFITLSETREEVADRFQKEKQDPDIASLFFVQEKELPETLMRMGGYKPFLLKTFLKNSFSSSL